MEKQKKYGKLPSVNVVDLGNLAYNRSGFYDFRFVSLKDMLNDMYKWQPQEIFKWDIPEKLEIGFGTQFKEKETVIRWSINYKNFVFEKEKTKYIFENMQELLELIHSNKNLIKNQTIFFPIGVLSF